MTHRKAVNITTQRKENNVNMSKDVLVTVFQYHTVDESRKVLLYMRGMILLWERCRMLCILWRTDGSR